MSVSELSSFIFYVILFVTAVVTIRVHRAANRRRKEEEESRIATLSPREMSTESAEKTIKQIKSAAVGTITVAGLNLVIGIALLGAMFGDPEGAPIAMLSIINVVSLLGLVGGVAMLRRQRYSMAILASVLLVIPFYGILFGLFFLLGVSNLRLLSKPAVRERFR